MIPPTIDMNAVQRVLIIKLSALGDIIHALPVAAALRRSFPHIELTWAVEEAFLPLVSGNPCLDHVLPLPKVRGSRLRSPAFHREYFRHLRDVRARRFDLTLDLQGLTKSALVAAASGARLRLGYHWLREAASFIERPVPRRPQSVHIVDQYLDVARFLGASTEQTEFPFHIPDEDQMRVDVMLRDAGIPEGAPFASINPASALEIKQWSAGGYAAVMDILSSRLRLPCVLVTADKSVASQVCSAATRPFVNLAGQTNLKQLAAVLQKSRLHICGDTGSGHMAAAFNTPVIALIGPTDADRICPYGQRSNAVQHSERCAAACTAHHCRFARPRCLEAIQVDEVVGYVERILNTVGTI